jgi:ribonuclease T2
MWVHRVWRAAGAAAVVFSFTFVVATLALAQDGALAGKTPPLIAAQKTAQVSVQEAVSATGNSTHDQRQSRNLNQPGHFDFYVLALSWSPSYCASIRERTPRRVPKQQCGVRPFAFVVHGLWPQYVRGFPSYCQHPAPRISRGLVDSMLDLMPSPRLVYHEWDRHGTCSGLPAKTYFASVRKARAVVKVPPAYAELAKPITVTPGEVEAAFLKANPGLRPSEMAVACDRKRLTEIRICLNKDFTFRDCAAAALRSCRLDKIAMPATRGG